MRRRLRKAVALEQEHVLDASLEQMQRGGTSEEAAADDDGFSPLGEAHCSSRLFAG